MENFEGFCQYRLDSEITPAFGCKQDCTLCLTSSLRIKLSLPGTASGTQGIRTVGRGEVHVIVDTDFSQRVSMAYQTDDSQLCITVIFRIKNYHSLEDVAIETSG